MIHEVENYYGVEEYARMSGVSVRNVRDNIRAQNLSYIKIDRFYFIRMDSLSNVKQDFPYLANPAAMSVTTGSFSKLREVGYFARGKHFCEGIIYEAIITGKLDAYVLGHKVFINPEEAEQFYKNREYILHLKPQLQVKRSWGNIS